MARGLLIGGGVAALVSGLAAAALVVAVTMTETPEAHVERYLEALAADQLPAAAALSGLEPGDALPLGDEGEPTVLRVVAAQPRDGGRVAVTALYGGDNDAATVIFLLEPAERLAGIIPQWRFVEPPVTRIPVGVDQHTELLVSGRALVTPGPGETAIATAFIPARVSVANAEPFLDAASTRIRPRSVAPPPVILTATPSERLVREVERQLTEVLDTCATQEVLQPSGCPFGRAVTGDRVIDRPAWMRVDAPQVSLTLSANPGRFSLDGSATMRVEVEVQSLFDGTVSRLTEDVVADVSGIVVLGPDGPVVTVYP
ncbi:hypothetical protein EV141_1651 [Microcella putealis]|uniref:Uncharacterized protein n=2 Tax=Microcella putealis TaxID=337005 RepID=A0A4Q7LQM7_9MICO|nr:hypothetical protein [Microcella putealis]RZS56198.1 hypothetical protein EV141_1651 [Microcella putealis]TQM23371.1 hypothetical protein BJ957_1733 [Microcella putealis]